MKTSCIMKFHDSIQKSNISLNETIFFGFLKLHFTKIQKVIPSFNRIQNNGLKFSAIYVEFLSLFVTNCYFSKLFWQFGKPAFLSWMFLKPKSEIIGYTSLVTQYLPVSVSITSKNSKAEGSSLHLFVMPFVAFRQAVVQVCLCHLKCVAKCCCNPYRPTTPFYRSCTSLAKLSPSLSGHN
jgi:hypothetical protein